MVRRTGSGKAVETTRGRIDEEDVEAPAADDVPALVPGAVGALVLGACVLVAVGLLRRVTVTAVWRITPWRATGGIAGSRGRAGTMFAVESVCTAAESWSLPEGGGRSGCGVEKEVPIFARGVPGQSALRYERREECITENVHGAKGAAQRKDDEGWPPRNNGKKRE